MRELYLHRRFFILLLCGAFASALAFIFPVLYAWVLWLLCVSGVLVVVDTVLLFGLGKSVEAVRIVGEKFSNGDENPVVVEVRNRYPFPVRLRMTDEIPVELQFRDLMFHVQLKTGELQQRTYFLRPVRRGMYTFGKLRIFVSSRLGLVERRYSFGKEHKVAVYPSFIAMRKYELLALTGSQSGNGTRKIRVAGITTFFDQIKPYIQGDDPRTVNWKATAKCNRLMVNSYTEERSQPVYCIVDKGRTMQSPFQEMTMLDYAINATLALSNVVLKKGDKAGLLTFSNKSGTLIKADNRRLQLNHITEALYAQQTHYLESDFEQLCITVSRQLHTRSLLVLFTNFDTVGGMKRRLPALRRLAENHLILLILFENTEINEVVTEPAENLQEMYFKVLAGSFISEKRRITRELEKAGIHTILTEPGQLTARAINGYLELKERGLI